VSDENARQQIKVIVADFWIDRLRRHIDEPRARLSEQEQQEKEPLLERLLPHTVHAGVEADRRDDDDCLLVLCECVHRRPQRREPALQRVESGFDVG